MGYSDEVTPVPVNGRPSGTQARWTPELGNAEPRCLPKWMRDFGADSPSSLGRGVDASVSNDVSRWVCYFLRHGAARDFSAISIKNGMSRKGRAARPFRGVLSG